MEVTGPNGQLYLVPRFYVPALNNSLDGFEGEKKLEIEKAAGTVSNVDYIKSRYDGRAHHGPMANNISLAFWRFLLTQLGSRIL